MGTTDSDLNHSGEDGEDERDEDLSSVKGAVNVDGMSSSIGLMNSHLQDSQLNDPDHERENFDLTEDGDDDDHQDDDEEHLEEEEAEEDDEEEVDEDEDEDDEEDDDVDDDGSLILGRDSIQRAPDYMALARNALAPLPKHVEAAVGAAVTPREQQLAAAIEETKSHL